MGGIGLSTIWVAYRNLRFKYRNALAALVSLVILLPAVKERRVFLQQNAEWSKSNLASLKSEEKDVTAVVSLLKAMPARTYSGLATNWGTRFRVGSVAFHGILSVNHIAAVSWPYHWMALTSDIVAVSFDETNPAHYRLFNVGAVVAPVAQPVPPFLALKASYGRFRIYQTPANGYFDIVNVPYAVRVYPKDFYAVSYGWLKSNWASRLSHLLMDTDGKIGSEMPQISASRPLPEAQAGPSLGFVSGERRTGEVYEARTEVQRPAYLLFKMTYHPNWRAIVDGVSQRPVMLTPGFMGVPLQPGTHEVRFQYEPGYLKTVLIVFGAFIIFGAVIINGSSEF